MPGRDEGSGGASAGGSPIRDALRPLLSGPVVVKHQSGASEVQGAQEISRTCLFLPDGYGAGQH